MTFGNDALGNIIGKGIVRLSNGRIKSVHTLNKVHLRTNSDKTPYDLWFGRPTSVNHFKVFGSKCNIKNNDDHLGKFDSRADEWKGHFTNLLGGGCSHDCSYSKQSTSKAEQW